MEAAVVETAQTPETAVRHRQIFDEVVVWKDGRCEIHSITLRFANDPLLVVNVSSYLRETREEHLVLVMRHRYFVDWYVREGEIGEVLRCVIERFGGRDTRSLQQQTIPLAAAVGA